MRERQGGERERAQRLPACGRHDDAFPVVRIREPARDEHEQQRRHEQGEADEAEIDRPVMDAVHAPAHGDRQNLNRTLGGQEREEVDDDVTADRRLHECEGFGCALA